LFLREHSLCQGVSARRFSGAEKRSIAGWRSPTGLTETHACRDACAERETAVDADDLGVPLATTS